MFSVASKALRYAAAFGCFALITIGVEAFGSDFFGIGTLPASQLSSEARGVDAQGNVVAGGSAASPAPQAIVWTELGGIQGIGANAFAQAISSDGTTIVGGIFDNLTNVTEPFIWTVADGLQRLGFPLGETPAGITTAEDVSEDGSVVVGSTIFSGQNQAFVWTAGAGFSSLASDLPGLGSNSTASGVSGDGQVIVGVSDSKAFRWTNSGGGVDLGTLSGGQSGATAIDVSENGAVVVGESSSATAGSEAFLWTEQGGMIGLGFLGNGFSHSIAFATTNNGEAVVGRNDTFNLPADIEAFLWTDTFGMESLQEVLIDRFGLGSQLLDWSLTSATDISPDGRSIVGIGINPDGNQEGWLVRLDQPIFVPEPTGIILSLAALISLSLSHRKRYVS